MVVISGIGLITPLGIGREANIGKLKNAHDAIILDDNFLVGKVNFTNNELKKLLHINEKTTISRTTLLGLIACQEAINDAQINPKTSAFINGTTVGGMDLTPLFYKKFINNPNLGGQTRYISQHDCAAGTNMIVTLCNIGGYNTTISTACSSGANAIMTAARLIESGITDTVIAGGTDALSLFTLNGFKSLSILSNEKCRPFCNTRNGLNLGEGAAYLVLQREDIARVTLCKLVGYANANDAYHQTAMTKEAIGPTLAMQKALNKAQIKTTDIDYINLHGTATENNDASESYAMKNVFAENIPPFSSTKPFTGHTLAAAGAIEAAFSIFAIQENLLWPNLNFHENIPNFPSPITTLTKKNINTVMSNSFGFGGNCTSLIFSK